MTDKELSRLNRAELLELLIEESKENARLKARLDEMEAELHSKQIIVAEAGNIAQAALQLNHVFEAAQAAADQYVDNMSRFLGEKDEIQRRWESEAKKAAEQILEEAHRKSQEMEEATARVCSKRLREASHQIAEIKKQAMEEMGESEHSAISQINDYAENTDEEVVTNEETE